MTYEEARTFIRQSNQYGSKLGLESITELLERLGNPQEKLKVIHVAGSNGKGSTTAFIATILSTQGYTVGRYISPAVFSYRERIQITTKENNNLCTQFITKQGICDAITLIAPICEAMEKEGFSHPTSFEIETAMAMLYFMWEKVDFAVVEVGLGGRLDATNVIKEPISCVITSISMDHMQYLGDTIEKITEEKAGIIKKRVPVVTGNTDKRVLSTLYKKCEELKTVLTLAPREEAMDISYLSEGTSFTYRGQRYTISLLGDHQISNALLAIETMNLLNQKGYGIDQTSIEEGLYRTTWSGRFEVLRRSPYVIIDGAHNEDAAIQLKKTLQTYFKDQKLILIMGVLADKDYGSILRILAPLAKVILTITPDNDRALASTQLAIEAKKYTDAEIIDSNTVQKAVTSAYNIANKEDIILAFGSLSYLSEVKTALLGS